ncbi:hypothetical protein GOODEAATRI_019226 [Goodea atripinnis]|uniref:Ectonucleoside triphosphate diphosphohydrolase 7 n=1 Tax=Goodea atripinnis TaxID=208336 RepID=A0ABV0NLI4_9TELE
MELGCTVTGLVDGCSRCGPMPSPYALNTMAKQTLILTLWLLTGSLFTEATYYRHHRYIPHFFRYREPSTNTENLLPDVANPAPEVSQSGVPTYPEVPEVFHPAPEVFHTIPEAFYPVPEVVHPAPETHHQTQVLQLGPEVRYPDRNRESRVFYGIMFDAGSTGTRIHIYKFIQKDPGVLAWVTVNFLTGRPFFKPLLSCLVTGYAGYKLCYYEVLRVVKGNFHQPYEVKGSSVFYAFSHYFDRAVQTGLVSKWEQASEPLSNAIMFYANYNLLHKVGIQIAHLCFLHDRQSRWYG